MLKKSLLLIILGMTVTNSLFAEEIGQVSTKFRFLTPNDKIKIEAFDDPKISGVTCYLSRATTGGAASIVGLQEDSSDASISCRQMGPITIKKKLKDGEQVFKKGTSLVFKSMQVVRFYDIKRKALVYLTYSDRIIEGSPKNAITVVPIQDWNGTPADIEIMEEKKIAPIEVGS